MRSSGAVRLEELLKMIVDNIQDIENLIMVEVPDIQTKIDGRFLITSTHRIY